MQFYHHHHSLLPPHHHQHQSSHNATFVAALLSVGSTTHATHATQVVAYIQGASPLQ